MGLSRRVLGPVLVGPFLLALKWRIDLIRRCAFRLMIASKHLDRVLPGKLIHFERNRRKSVVPAKAKRYRNATMTRNGGNRPTPIVLLRQHWPESYLGIKAPLPLRLFAIRQTTKTDGLPVRQRAATVATNTKHTREPRWGKVPGPTQRGFFFSAYFVGHSLSISIMI